VERIAWAIEMVGNYTRDPFDSGDGAIVRDNAVHALAVLHIARGLDPKTIKFHKEDPRTTHKTCPGKNVVKADVHQARAGKTLKLALLFTVIPGLALAQTAPVVQTPDWLNYIAVIAVTVTMALVGWGIDLQQEGRSGEQRNGVTDRGARQRPVADRAH
jgi:hypothetical protein